MLGDDVDVTQGTFQEHFIGDDASIHAVLITGIQTKQQVQNLVDEKTNMSSVLCSQPATRPAASFESAMPPHRFILPRKTESVLAQVIS